jgi:uncharacterized LabA/DUF88 family protein
MSTAARRPSNHAFIDAQNIHLGVRDLGWSLDYRRLRIWLTGRFQVSKALLFIGYVPANQSLYAHLRQCGFELVFKEIDLASPQHKGDIDVDLTLQAATTTASYDRAVLMTSDGDFAPLVRYLIGKKQFAMVVSPHPRTCSRFLKKASRGQITYLSDVRSKVARYRKQKGRSRRSPEGAFGEPPVVIDLNIVGGREKSMSATACRERTPSRPTRRRKTITARTRRQPLWRLVTRLLGAV